MVNRKNLTFVAIIGVVAFLYSTYVSSFPNGNEVLLAQLGSSSGSGWTEFSPSADTRVVYVSSSTGSDTNDGLSEGTAKKTISAGKSLLRHGYPDGLLLKRGDVFNESLGQWKMSGRSASEPMLISSYGVSSVRPLLKTGTGGAVWTNNGGGSPPTITNVAFTGLHFLADTYDGANGNEAGVSFLQPGSNILFEDFKIEGYRTGIVFQGFGGSLQNYTLRRSVILNSYTVHSVNGSSQGMYAYDVQGLLMEENVFYHNGWSETVAGAGADIFSHNIYIDNGNSGVILRGNIIADGSSHGAQMRSGGVIENNLFVRNSIAFVAGGGNSPAANGVMIDIQDNVILDGKNINSSEKRGWGMVISNVSSGTIADNIIANNVLGTQPVAIAMQGMHKGENGQLDFGIHNLALQNNTIYEWGGGLQIDGVAPRVTNISLSGNNFQHSSLTTPHLDHQQSGGFSEFNSSNNTFYSSTPDSGATKWTTINQTLQTLGFWKNQVGDTTSGVLKQTYLDPMRSVATYNASIGGVGTYSAFITGALQQSKGNWNDAYTAANVNNYIRSGFETAVSLPAVSISTTDATASEAGSDTGLFTISRTGSTANALPIVISISGTATNGVDYQTIITSPVIAANQSSVLVDVIPINDVNVENTESVTVMIVPSAGYTTSSSNTGTVTLLDNDSAPSPPPPPPPPPGDPLSPPTVSTFCSGSATEATVSWLENGSSGAQGFYVDIDTDGNWVNGFWYKFVPAGTLVAIVPQGFVPTVITQPLVLVSGQSYSVRVLYSAAQAYSEIVAFTPTQNCDTALLPPPVNSILSESPSNVTAYAISENEIRLFWKGGSEGQTGYKLEMSTNGTNFAQIRDLPPHYYFWNEKSLTANTKYYFRIRAYNSAGDSEYSNVIDATTKSAGGSFTFTRSLRTGDTGNDVKVLQQCLNAQGFIIASSGTGSSGKETTFFGSLTAAALKELQNTHATEILIPVGIPAGGGTGIFGASTRMYMNTLGCKGGGLTDKPFSRVLLVGSSGEDVMLLQLYLAQNKIIYPEGTVSGYYGNLTRQAVIRFQKKNKLSETGIVDAETQNSIHSFYNVIP
ncbi:MAG: peptidoglycan-binding protein [Patescibacteria group bacterium]